MKKLLVLFGVALLLTACASTATFSQNCIVQDCDIAAVHHHAIY